MSNRFTNSYVHSVTWLLQSSVGLSAVDTLTLKVLVATIDAHWEGMGDVGSARYEPALLQKFSTLRVNICKPFIS